MPRAKPYDQLTERGKKMKNLDPVPITRAAKKRGASAAPKITEARAALKSSNSAASASEIDPDKPLTEKQRQFAKFWSQGDTIPNATLRAGFAQEGVGYRMARMPNILRVYNAEKALYEEAGQVTRKSVMDMHLEAFEMAKLMAEPSTMVAAARELGKMAGYYAPVEHKVKVDVTGNIVLDKMNSMTDAELLRIISAGSNAATALPYI